jgi:ribose transport system ATP-binding protein
MNLIPELTVAQNIFLGREPRRAGGLFVDVEAARRQSAKILASLGQQIDPDTQVKTLSVPQQQMVEVAKALSMAARLVIFDEPTDTLAEKETEALFRTVRLLKAKGIGIIYISHRLEEIQRLADRITVLRNGCLVATSAADGISLDEIVRLMVGREIKDLQRGGRREFTGVGLRVSGLCRGDLVRNVSLEVRRGEILGLAGLMGSGRTETLRAIFGADRPEKGSIFLHDSPRPARIRSPHDAVRQGIALLTEDP